MAAPNLAAFIIHSSVRSPTHQIMLLNTCDCQSTFLGLVVGNKYERQEDPAAHIGPRQLTEKSFDGR